jgi:hypothetical protein
MLLHSHTTCEAEFFTRIQTVKPISLRMAAVEASRQRIYQIFGFLMFKVSKASSCEDLLEHKRSQIRVTLKTEIYAQAISGSVVPADDPPTFASLKPRRQGRKVTEKNVADSTSQGGDRFASSMKSQNFLKGF